MIEERKLKLRNGWEIPLYSVNTLVVGSGAAGLGCIERIYRFLQERGIETPLDKIALATNFLGGGTSNNSGSDKQTYYRLNVLGRRSPIVRSISPKPLPPVGVCTAILP